MDALPFLSGGLTPSMVPNAQIKPKGGMFGGDGKFGIGQAIVAALNGYLAGTGNPVGAQNMQMMQALAMKRQERQQELSDYNRKRMDENSDWRTHYDYEKANPKTEPGSEYERLLAAAGITPGTPAYQQHVTSKVNQLENPIVMTPYGPMPYSQINPTAPTAPVGKLTPIPGGPVPQAPGGFSY